MTEYKPHPHNPNPLSRKRKLTLRRASLISILAVLILLATPPLVSSIQNIFTGLSQVADIQHGGQNIDKVIYRGETIWERQEADTGVNIQLVGSDKTYLCPTARTRVVDARDNATYFIQKLADGKCWMLTNLAYGGGGINTYGDVKAITNSNTMSYITPYFMVPPGSNKTVEPQNPSTSTTGVGQYGYLYNWCAAMGAQTGTSACLNAATPLPDPDVSICPSGWRLPSGGSSATAIDNEFGILNASINGGSTSTDYGLRSVWLGMYNGSWVNGFLNQGSGGGYWSSTQGDATGSYDLYLYPNEVGPGTSNVGKDGGRAVRCVAV